MSEKVSKRPLSETNGSSDSAAEVLHILYSFQNFQNVEYTWYVLRADSETMKFYRLKCEKSENKFGVQVR